jgi:hypothetical protein
MLIKEIDPYRNYIIDTTIIRLKAYDRARKTIQFHPVVPSTFFIGNYHLGPAKSGLPYFPVALVSDSDGVLTVSDKSIAFAWLSGLAELLGNRIWDRISTALSKVVDRLRIHKEESMYKKEQLELIKELRDAGVTKDIHMKASQIAWQKAVLAPGAQEFCKKLREELGITVSQISGCPQEPLKEFGYKRLLIPYNLSEGSIFKWHKGKLIEDIYSNVGYNKLKVRDIQLKRIGCTRDLAVYPNDSFKDDFPTIMEAGLGLCAYIMHLGDKDWIKKETKDTRWGKKILEYREALKSEIHGKRYLFDLFDPYESTSPNVIAIGSEEFSKDLTTLIEPIRIWLLTRLILYMCKTPEVYLGIVLDAQALKKLGSECREAKSEAFYILRDKFLACARSFRKNPVIDFIFSDVSRDVDECLEELERIRREKNDDIEMQKNLINEIENELESRHIEFHINEGDIDKIREYVRFQKELKGWRSIGI